jgi:hypothetical protein
METEVRVPHRLRQANTILAQANSRYEAELSRHYQPGGVFQQSILAKYREESAANLEGVQSEHEKRMQKLEQEYVARQKFWENQERVLNIRFQVCNNKWP